jgi:hypothetical protein
MLTLLAMTPKERLIKYLFPEYPIENKADFICYSDTIHRQTREYPIAKITQTEVLNL